MSFLGNNSIVNESSASSQIENYKIVIIGDQHVGKASILSRYKYELIETAYAPTVGIDFLTKNVFLEDKTVKLIMWDTAGQERFKSLIPSYLKNANCIILTYDISNKSSFVSLNKWLMDAQEYVNEKTLFAICGNKLDLKRAVTKKEVEDFSNGKNIPLFIEVSALTGEGINDLFNNIVKTFCDRENKANSEIKMDELNSEDNRSQQFSLKDKNKKEDSLIKTKKRRCC